MFNPDESLASIAPRVDEMLQASRARGGPEDLALHEKGALWGLLIVSVSQMMRLSHAPDLIRHATLELMADLVKLYHPKGERDVILSIVKATGADAADHSKRA